MIIARRNTEIREIVKSKKSNGNSVSLVPTMGALHEGHLSLINLAKANSQFVICYIFVNPTQFNNPSDLEKYPRTLETDIELLKDIDCDCLFAPDLDCIYPDNFDCEVLPSKTLSAPMEGLHRPGHFAGVCTVLAKFFNIVDPDFAVFGEKDFQQLRIVEQMVKDLNFPTQIIRAPLIREESGLALSSRNQRLNPSDRKLAAQIYFALESSKQLFLEGETEVKKLVNQVQTVLAQSPDFELEYVEITDENLVAQTDAKAGNRIFIAAWLSGIRLIDNLKL